VRVCPTTLASVFELQIESTVDERGFFARMTDAADLERLTEGAWKAPYSAMSHNDAQFTLRGLHWQAAPAGETKIVRCLSGSIFDVVVNVDPEASQYGQWTSVVLDANSCNALLIPPNHAHGFLTLERCSRVMYEICGEYRPEYARTFHWNDEMLAIEWPTTPQVVGARDRAAGSLADVMASQFSDETTGNEAVDAHG
jgi:dTDP-4-dehydrorhamnose 3,5-epimerase